MNKHTLIKLVTPAALSASLLMSVSCTSTTIPEADVQTEHVVSTQGSEPGMYSLETTKVTAKVTAVNSEKRKITVVFPEGKKHVVKAGPEVSNFNQIKVGDQLTVAIAEEMVVRLAADGVKLLDGTMAVIAAATPGEKPGIVAGTTSQITAKVIGLDRKNRKAVIQTPDGKTHTFDIRKDIDLSQRKIGEELVIRYTEALSIIIE